VTDIRKNGRLQKKLLDAERSPEAGAIWRRLRLSSNRPQIQEALFATTFHRLPAVIAELVFLLGETVQNRAASAAAIDARAKLLCIFAAGAPVRGPIPFLR
jgi:hypothetical protein